MKRLAGGSPRRDGAVDRLWRLALRVAYWLALGAWYLLRPRGRGAYVALWVGDRLLLVRNAYKRGFTLPCGNLAPGETPRAAAVRELDEEVAIAAPPESLALVGAFHSRLEFRRDQSVVFELHLESEPEPRPDGREVVSAGFVAREALTAYPVGHILHQYLAFRGIAAGPLVPR